MEGEEEREPKYLWALVPVTSATSAKVGSHCDQVRRHSRGQEGEGGKEEGREGSREQGREDAGGEGRREGISPDLSCLGLILLAGEEARVIAASASSCSNSCISALLPWSLSGKEEEQSRSSNKLSWNEEGGLVHGRKSWR